MAAAVGVLAAAGTAFAAPSSDTTRVEPPPPKASAPPAWIAVRTIPPGLRVRIGAIEAGWSPIAPTAVHPGRVTVRAFPVDARRFDPVTDGATLDAAPGETLRVVLDLRPHPLLLSEPVAGVSLLRTQPDRPDSLVGETPLRLAPSILESHRVRFAAPGYADSVMSGAALLAAAGGGAGSARVVLRSLHLPPPAPPPPPRLFGRRWFQWTLIGAGAILTGGAAHFRQEADRAYDRYLDATNPRVIEEEYDRTVRYDRWAAGTLGAGQVLLTGGIFLLVSGVGR